MSVDISLKLQNPAEVDGITEEYLEVWDGNFTSNLGGMARALKIAEYLYGSSETQGMKAEEFIIPIEAAAYELSTNGEAYKQYESSNGWGTVKQLSGFLRGYLEALKEYPDAEVYFI